jgi:hypothetical protein
VDEHFRSHKKSVRVLPGRDPLTPFGMLHLPLRGTDKVDLVKSLFRFVESAYSTEQAEAHRDAFFNAASLRERVRHAVLSEEKAAENVRLIARYYRLLTHMRTRFGAGADEEQWEASFSWREAFRPSEGPLSRPEMAFEAASVLFNLGTPATARSTPAWRAREPIFIPPPLAHSVGGPQSIRPISPRAS